MHIKQTFKNIKLLIEEYNNFSRILRFLLLKTCTLQQGDSLPVQSLPRSHGGVRTTFQN